MIPSYQDTLKFLYDNLPMFQRVGAAAIKKDLTNTLKLCKALGNPQDRFKSIHVAGTNGKGSTCHMLSSILQTGGYRTGLYTSPHLKEFTERIKVNGKEISKDFVVDFVNRIRPAIDEIKPSFFEITVAMAFDYFASEEVDVAVVEVGLGGRLDSTNIITPVLSVITNISWDHKDLLGESLPEIAAEKAGIIKRDIPIVISERQPDIEKVFVDKAARENAALFFASDEYHAVMNESSPTLDVFRNDRPLFSDVPFPLPGKYQRHNIPGVLKAVDLLQPSFPVSAADVRQGLSDVIANTGLKGRWQILYHNPTVVCDTAHNESGVREIVRQIAQQKFKDLFFVLGMVRDKDVKQILALLPPNAGYYFCQAKIPRAMPAGQLRQLADEFNLKGEVIPDVNEAKNTAMQRAGTNDLIFIGGSTYVVAELDEV